MWLQTVRWTEGQRTKAVLSFMKWESALKKVLFYSNGFDFKQNIFFHFFIIFIRFYFKILTMQLEKWMTNNSKMFCYVVRVFYYFIYTVELTLSVKTIPSCLLKLEKLTKKYIKIF